MSALTIARGLLARGLSVIPIPRADGGRFDGKVPAIAWRPYQAQHPTDAELVAWFPDGVPMNLGIITGAVSGVVVVDVDSEPARRWFIRRFPYSPWQTRTGKGYHLFFRHPGVLVKNRARIATPEGTRLEIDVRGDAGYVIAPGSIHMTGATYSESGDWTQPREALPVFWPGWLARPTAPSAPPPRTPPPAGDVVDRARRYLAAIPVPQIGQGSDAATFYAAARMVHGFALSESAAVSLLWDWCGDRPGWSYDWIAAKVTAAVRYGSEAVGGLR